MSVRWKLFMTAIGSGLIAGGITSISSLIGGVFISLGIVCILTPFHIQTR